MGWNVFYKECKYIAAHSLLRKLYKHKVTYKLSTYGEPASNINDIEPIPQWVKLKDLQKELKIFPINMIKDAAFMMAENSTNSFLKEVDLLNNKIVSEIEVKILWEGETALKDRKYWRKLFNSAKIILPLIFSVIYTIYDLAKKIF